MTQSPAAGVDKNSHEMAPKYATKGFLWVMQGEKKKRPHPYVHDAFLLCFAF